MSASNGYWMQTFSGERFDYTLEAADVDKLVTEQINITDIAHALSLICRFNGHCKYHYSVAQHSVLVAKFCPDELALAGLLHDAAEAYIGDIVTSLKGELNSERLRTIEHTLELRIGILLGVQLTPMHPFIAHADMVALATEKRDVMAPSKHPWCQLPKPDNDYIQCQQPYQAEAEFLKVYERLRKDKSQT